MTNSGTRYAGTSTSGKCDTGPVVTSPLRLGTKPELSAPMVTATTRSRMPRTFQITKSRLPAKFGRRTRASATHGAVTPIAMSPHPAGQVKELGNTPLALRARKPRPPARQAWRAASRATSALRIASLNARHPRYAAMKTTNPKVAPIRIGMGGVPGARMNAPLAPSTSTSTNQLASTPVMNHFMIGSFYMYMQLLGQRRSVRAVGPPEALRGLPEQIDGSIAKQPLHLLLGCFPAGHGLIEQLPARTGEAERLLATILAGDNLKPALAAHELHISAERRRIKLKDLAHPQWAGQSQLPGRDQNVHLTGLEPQGPKGIVVHVGDDAIQKSQAHRDALAGNSLELRICWVGFRGSLHLI